MVVGRVLRNAGDSVMFAVTKEDAECFAQREKIALAVLNAELADDYAATIGLARSAGSKASFIICANPKDLKTIRGALDGAVGVGVIDAFAPPENVLFASNDLRRFNHNENATVPPGLGLSIIDGAKVDLQTWSDAYGAISAALG